MWRFQLDISKIGVLQISNLGKVVHVFRQGKLYIIWILIINLTFQLRNPTASLWNKITVRHEVVLKLSSIEHGYFKCYDSKKR